MLQEVLRRQPDSRSEEVEGSLEGVLDGVKISCSSSCSFFGPLGQARVFPGKVPRTQKKSWHASSAQPELVAADAAGQQSSRGTLTYALKSCARSGLQQKRT